MCYDVGQQKKDRRYTRRPSKQKEYDEDGRRQPDDIRTKKRTVFKIVKRS